MVRFLGSLVVGAAGALALLSVGITPQHLAIGAAAILVITTPFAWSAWRGSEPVPAGRPELPPSTTPKDKPKPNVVPQADIDTQLDAQAMPAVYLQRCWPGEAPTGTVSRLGGLPSLPAGLNWPRDPKQGAPLHFLAQIDCAELPETEGLPDLPDEGVLFFFGDISAEMDWEAGPAKDVTRVLYTTEDVRNVPGTAVPVDLPDLRHADAATGGPLARVGKKTYRAWQVTPHVIPTWAEGFDPRAKSANPDFLKQAEARSVAAIAAVLPKLPQERGVDRLLVVEPLDPPEENAGTGRWLREKLTIVPDALGGHFPYTAGIAATMVRQLMSADTRNRTIYRGLVSDKAEKAPEQVERFQRTLDFLEKQLETSQTVYDRLVDLPPGHDLSDRLREAFDLWLDVQLNSGLYDALAFSRMIQTTLDVAAAQGLGDIGLRQAVPPAVLDEFRRILAPRPGLPAHMIGGAKSFARKATGGKGVRLLQLHSDDGAEFVFGNNGIVEFWISPENLKARKFSEACGAATHS